VISNSDEAQGGYISHGKNSRNVHCIFLGDNY